MSSQRHATYYELPSYQFVTDPNYDETLSGRVRAACITCSRRKIKCSGGVPCETCLSHNRRCEGLKTVTRWEKKRNIVRKRTSSAGQTRLNAPGCAAGGNKTVENNKYNQGIQHQVNANVRYVNTPTQLMGLEELSMNQSATVASQTMPEQPVPAVETPAPCLPTAELLTNLPPGGLQSPALSMTEMFSELPGLGSPHQFDQPLYSTDDAPIDMTNAASCIFAAECLEHQARILRLRALGQRHDSVDIGQLSIQQHPLVTSGPHDSPTGETLQSLAFPSFDCFEWSKTGPVNGIASELREEQQWAPYPGSPQ